MQAFIHYNLLYPLEAWKKCIEGVVIVKIEVKGAGIKKAEIVHDIGYGCGEEALRVVGLIPYFTLGNATLNPARRPLFIPVKFSLFGYHWLMEHREKRKKD
jgi:protein TonB